MLASQPFIDALKQPVARFFIRFYWLPVLASLAIYLVDLPHRYVTPKHFLLEVSFFPINLLAAGLAKFFFTKKLPLTFVELQKAGALPEAAVPAVSQDFQSRLDNRVVHAFGAGGAFLLFFF